MESLTGLLGLPASIVVHAILQAVVGFPVLIAVLLMAAALRKRISYPLLRGLLVAGFALTSGFALYRMEWYDVWRHGTPSPSYMVTAYVPHFVVFSGLGWLIARRMKPDANPTV